MSKYSYRKIGMLIHKSFQSIMLRILKVKAGFFKGVNKCLLYSFANLTSWLRREIQICEYACILICNAGIHFCWIWQIWLFQSVCTNFTIFSNKNNNFIILFLCNKNMFFHKKKDFMYLYLLNILKILERIN